MKPQKKKQGEKGIRKNKNTPHNLATSLVITLQMPASTRGHQRHHVLQLLGKQILGNPLGEKKRVYEFASQIPRKEETHNANLVVVVGVVFAKWSSDNKIKGEKKMRRKKQQT